MLQAPGAPTLSRVMRVQPRPDERPAAGFSWGDYEDVDESRVTADDADGEDEGGWVTKSSRKQTRTFRIPLFLTHLFILVPFVQDRSQQQSPHSQHLKLLRRNSDKTSPSGKHRRLPRRKQRRSVSQLLPSTSESSRSYASRSRRHRRSGKVLGWLLR